MKERRDTPMKTMAGLATGIFLALTLVTLFVPMVGGDAVTTITDAVLLASTGTATTEPTPTSTPTPTPTPGLEYTSARVELRPSKTYLTPGETLEVVLTIYFDAPPYVCLGIPNGRLDADTELQVLSFPNFSAIVSPQASYTLSRNFRAVESGYAWVRLSAFSELGYCYNMLISTQGPILYASSGVTVLGPTYLPLVSR
jgi:hypothetical protein